MSFSILTIRTMYDFAIRKDIDRIPIDIVENAVASNQQLLDRYLSEKSKAYLYGLVMASAYGQLKKYNDALDRCNKH